MFGFIIVLILSFVIGAFGFPQIVGTIKYHHLFRPKAAFFTIFLWLIILGTGCAAVMLWLNKYAVALYIGYGMSFLFSLTTKPDK